MGDDGREIEEKKAHRVRLDAFYIGKYPVTNAEYARFMADRGRGFETPAGMEYHPVTNVSWFDAKDYADWAGMRLLTEAEWEKAASWEADDKVTWWHGEKVKGTKRKYPWGDEFDKTRCNTDELGIGPSPVGSFSPVGDSPCGAADMAGNVWEWCSSQHRHYPYRADDGRENLTDYASRVQRGGSFVDDPVYARCASRYDDYPSDRFRDYGLRVGWRAPFPLASGNSEL